MRVIVRSVTLAVVLLAMIAPALQAQAKDQLYTATQQQLDVTKVLIAQSNAWNKANLEAYVSFYKDASDTVAVLAGAVRGLQNIRNAYSLNFPRAEVMGTLDESAVEVRELGENFALATGHYHLTRTKKGGGDADGSFLNILEKTPAGWKIIYSENN